MFLNKYNYFIPAHHNLTLTALGDFGAAVGYKCAQVKLSLSIMYYNT